MKKILRILVISLLLFSNVNAEERINKLEKLFTQLKNKKLKIKIDKNFFIILLFLFFINLADIGYNF